MLIKFAYFIHIQAIQSTECRATSCFTCGKIFWRTKHNTIGAFVIQWDVNKWSCILWFSQIKFILQKLIYFLLLVITREKTRGR